MSAASAISNNTASASRLAIWLKKLPQNPLPIDRHIAQKIQDLLKDDLCDAKKLNQLIRQDPILCLRLFHCAEKGLQKHNNEVQHIIHLVGLIGLNKIAHTIENNPHRSDNIPEGFREILSASLFAGHLSTALLTKKHGYTHDRLFLPTLFFNAPLWFMWAGAPKTMSQGQQLASKQQQPYIPLSTKKLGFPLADLLAKAETFVHLPSYTLQALAINPSDNIHFWAKAHQLDKIALDYWLSENKKRRHYFYSVPTGIYLLNQYVIAIYFDWNGKHIQRYKKLLCNHLGVSEKNLETQVAEQAMSTPLPNSFQGTLSPIKRLQGKHLTPSEKI